MSVEVWGPGELEVDIDAISKVVEDHFVVYRRHKQPYPVGFEVQVDDESLEEVFENLRLDMEKIGYTPALVDQGDKVFINIIMPTPDGRPFGAIKGMLLFATLVIIFGSGMLFTSGYEDVAFGSWDSIWRGFVFFTVPLLAILAVHEYAHRLVATKYGVDVGFPYIIPGFPVWAVFGTVISIPRPLPSRRSMVDIGIIGPVVGFISSVLVTSLGLIITASDPHPAGDDVVNTVRLSIPLVFGALDYIIQTPENVLIHPTVFVGLVGFSITFFVLLPVGNLDGGYVARAIFRDRAKWVGGITVVLVVSISIFSGYWGNLWLIILLLVYFVIWKDRPPLNDRTPLPRNRWAAGITCLVLLVVCFIPPSVPTDIVKNISAEFEAETVDVINDSYVNNTLIINNIGNTRVDVSVRLLQTHGWHVAFEESVKFSYDISRFSEPFPVERDASTSHKTTLEIQVGPSEYTGLGDMVDFVVELQWYDEDGISRTILTDFRATVIGS